LDEDSLFFDALEGEPAAEPPLAVKPAALSSLSMLQVMPSVAASVASSASAHSKSSTSQQPSPDSTPARSPTSAAGGDKQPYGVAAAVEVDEMRLVRQSVGQKGRRTLYAFSVGSLLDGRAFSLTSFSASSASASASSSGGGTVRSLQCVLRTYNEWAKVFPILKCARGCNRVRLSDTEKRRLDLEHSFRIAVRESADDATARTKLESFLLGGEHTSAFLTTTPGIGLGVSAKRLRNDLPNFRLESLVIVQCGNHFWSEEFMGLTTDEVTRDLLDTALLRI